MLDTSKERSNQKYIFLDIDGVLVCEQYFKFSDKHKRNEFSPSAVSALKHLIDQTGAFLVISSSWRLNFNSVQELKTDLFAHYGLAEYVFGRTPVLPHQARGEEISSFMALHDITPNDIVILDDDTDMGDLIDRLVKTSFSSNGLTENHAKEAYNLLTKES